MNPASGHQSLQSVPATVNSVPNSNGQSVRVRASRAVVMMVSLAALLIGSGCSIVPRLAVNVDAVDSGQAVQDVRYVLKPVVKGVDESDLHFIEYSRHIDNALQKHGMTKAGSADEANIEIAVNYGVRRQQRALLQPSVFDEPFFYKRRCRARQNNRCVRWYRPFYFDHHDWYHERHRRQVDVITNYRVFVSLEARLKDADNSQSALWTTRARAHFAKPDLRVTLPLLLIAAGDYIGVDSGRERTVVLSGDDLAVVSSKIAGKPVSE